MAPEPRLLPEVLRRAAAQSQARGLLASKGYPGFRPTPTGSSDLGALFDVNPIRTQIGNQARTGARLPLQLNPGPQGVWTGTADGSVLPPAPRTPGGAPRPTATGARPATSTSYTPDYRSFTNAADDVAGVVDDAVIAGADDAAAATGFMGRMAAARNTLPGFLGKGGWKGTAGNAALGLGTAALADRFVASDTDNTAAEFGRGFLKGAGWAPLAAPAIAAIPGVNLVGLPLLGAAAGISGIAGGIADALDLGDLFGGGKDDKGKGSPERLQTSYKSTIQLLTERRASDEVIQLFKDQYDATMFGLETATDEELVDAEGNKMSRGEAYDLASKGLRDQVVQYLLDPDGFREATGLNENAKTLQLQAAIGSMIEPYAAAEETAGNNIAQYYIDEGNRIGGPRGQQLIAQGNQMKASSSQLANAYRMQAQMIPFTQKLESYNSYQDQFNQQVQQRQMSAEIESMYGAGGGTDPATDDALAQFG